MALRYVAGFFSFVLLGAAAFCYAVDDETHNVELNCLPDYMPQGEAIDPKCVAFGCGVVSGKTLNPPFGPSCVFPKNWGYKLNGSDFDGASGVAQLVKTAELRQKYSAPKNVKLEAVKEGPQRLQLKFSDNEDATRFEIPPSVITLAKPSQEGEVLYGVKVAGEKDKLFSLKVTRAGAAETVKPILDTANLPGFTFEDQFIEISFRLPTDYIYGFGEHEHSSLKHSFDYYYLPMFTRAHGVGGASADRQYPNLYGVHPFFMGMDSEGKAYGVLFWNSNAQEVFLQPGNILTYRTIGGVLDMRIMFGPTPRDVIQQYHGMIGKPHLPPYWALGFQLSKYWYGDLATLEALNKRMVAAKIPWDVQTQDIDYMDRQRAFTTDPVEFAGLRAFIEARQSEGMRSVVIFDPAITANDTVWSPDTPGQGTPDPEYAAWIEGAEQDVFIRFPDDEVLDDGGNSGAIAFGKVWPDYPNSTKAKCHARDVDWSDQVPNCRAWSGFPDFFKTATKDWWVSQSKKFHAGGGSYGEGLPFDGMWIDMNEPENFVVGTMNYQKTEVDRPVKNGCPIDTKGDGTNKAYNDPPYIPHLANRDEGISTKTICLSTLVEPEAGKKIPMYNMHSLYGYSMAVPTLAAANASTPGKRSMVFSRSTFPGTGKLIGHWLGDNSSTWESMRRSVIGIQEMNIFGITYTGADICGFFETNKDEFPELAGGAPKELCYRWMQVGAFYTFSRNHGTKHKPEQDPANFGEDLAEASRKVLEIRYTLLPYLYTVMNESHLNGGTVLRSLMEEFHTDKRAWVIEEQFMWGSGLLITPVLTEGADSVTGYVPAGRWYNYHDGKEIYDPQPKISGRDMTFYSFKEDCKGDIPLLVRGGYILPGQAPAVTTTAARSNTLEMHVALDYEGKAEGSLFWDEGDSIVADDYPSVTIGLSVTNRTITTTVNAKNGYNPTLTWGKVVIMGVGDTPVNGMISAAAAAKAAVHYQPMRGSFHFDFLSAYGSYGLHSNAAKDIPFEYREETESLHFDLTASSFKIMDKMDISWTVGPPTTTTSTTSGAATVSASIAAAVLLPMFALMM